MPLDALRADAMVPLSVELEPARAAGGKPLPAVSLELLLTAAEPASLRTSDLASDADDSSAVLSE